MSIGGKRTVRVPPELGFGSSTVGGGRGCGHWHGRGRGGIVGGVVGVPAGEVVGVWVRAGARGVI